MEPNPQLDDRWFFELAWLIGDAEIQTPEQRLRRLAERLACANPHSPAEMGFLVDLANALVHPGTPNTGHN